MCPSQIIVGNRFHPLAFILIQGNPHNRKVFIFIFIKRLYHIRILATTRRTPGCPEIQQYIFTSEIRKRNRYSCRIWQRKFRSHLPYLHIFQLLDNTIQIFYIRATGQFGRNLGTSRFQFIQRQLVSEVTIQIKSGGRRSRILGDQTVYVIPFFKNLLGILLKDCIDRRITDRNRFAVITYPHIHIRIFDKELNRIIHIFCCQTKQ